MENSEALDIYSFIGSPVIREYFRTHREFTTKEKIRLILSSWTPMTTKLQALKELKENAEGEERIILEYIEPLYVSIFNSINKPVSKNVIFAGRCLSNSDELDLVRLTDKGEAYGRTTEKVINEWIGYTQPHILDIDCIDLDRDCEILYTFYVVVEDEKYEVIKIIPNEEVYAKDEFEAEFLDIITDDYNRYSLPFKFGENVKIVLPYLGEYKNGFMDSSMDGNGCWYHFIHYDRDDMDNFDDVSYFWITWGRGLFNVYDCLYETDESKQEGLKPPTLSKYRKINDIVADGGRYGFTACLIEIVGWTDDEYPMLEVKLQDDTGTIRGYIRIHDNDDKWLYEAMNNNEELFFEGRFDEHDSGEVFMDYSIGVTRL